MKKYDNVIIREAEPADAAQLLAYLKQVGGESDNLSFGPEGLPFTVEQEEEYLRSLSGDPRNIMISAWSGDELVGNASLSALPRRTGHRAELGITVLKDAWSQGIGRALMETLIARAKESGIEIIQLDVRSDNARAIRLYESCGFRHIGTFPAALKISGEYFDTDAMVLDLRQE